MRLVWNTDPHLNHVAVTAWDRWITSNRDAKGDAFLITGDISEGEDVAFQLQRLYESLGKPIYFVLGNHDFYHSSFAQTRRQVIDMARDNPHLIYLTDTGAVEIDEGVHLVGDDGWGDATLGDYEGSIVRLNDFALIEDFQQSPMDQWQTMLNHLGQEAAQRLAQKLLSIPESAAEILVITHVPPFREACWYQGKTTDDNWAPFFVCGELGNVLRQLANDRPDCNINVLCGHTHNDGIATMADNLTVYTGSAVYASPKVEGIVETEAHRLTLKLHQ